MPRSRRLKILHAIHDFLPRHCAGSEIYAARLCQELARRHDVAVLCAEYDPQHPHGSVHHRHHDGLDVIEIYNNWAFRDFADSYASPFLSQRLADVLDEQRPDVLHLHSLLNLSLELPALAAARGIPVVMTLHDHHLFCPGGGQRVHVAEEHVCDELDPARCARCFAQSPFHGQLTAGRTMARVNARGPLAQLLRQPTARALLAGAVDLVRRRQPRAFEALLRLTGATLGRGDGATPAAIDERLARVRSMFQQVDLFVAPSAALGEAHARLGLPRDRLEISDYGFRPLAAVPARPARKRLVIGFVGTLVWHKGVHVLLAAARRLPAKSFRLKIFGALDTFPEYTARIRALAAGLPVEFVGGFANEDAARIYGQLDVLVVPSLWPENSPLVIHEAAMAGVPVVGARVGGIVDLIRHKESGLLYDAFSDAELARGLESLITDRALLHRLRGALPAVKSIAADAAEWEQRYRRLCAPRRRGPARRS